jgi:predicted nucleic acid-binding protein
VIILDASAVVDLVCDAPGAAELRERVLADGSAHTPTSSTSRFGSALGLLAADGELSPDRAADALVDAGDLPIVRYPHRTLIERAWELRAHLTIHDGVYIALAELLDAPLLTCDTRLARACGHGATIEVV